MANLQKQIDALTAYFQADCARPGVLPIALTIEHFITRLDGTPVDYAQLAQVIYSMQGHDEPLREDNVYLGFRCPSYTITIQAGCQVTISGTVSHCVAGYGSVRGLLYPPVQRPCGQ